VFVIDVLEPLWSESDDRLGGLARPHLFVVSGDQHLETPPGLCCYRVDLADAPPDDPAEQQWFTDHTEQMARVSGDVLMTHFERRLPDRRFNQRKLALLEHVIHVLGRTVIIVSAAPPGNLFRVTDASRDPGDADASGRWADLLSRFIVVPARPVV